MELINVKLDDIDIAVDIINMGKKHLKEQNIDQWQNEYPDYECIKNDIINQKGYFVSSDEEILAYLCIDFDGEPAYESLNGTWASEEEYVVVHRLAFSDNARGKGLTEVVFMLVAQLCIERGVRYFRVDTDADNLKMQHILKKSGFTYRGIVNFDNSEKIAFDMFI